MSRVRPEYTLDFSGGLNLRDDVFGLGENESPEMLNVEIDGRGGFQTRKGWQWVGVPESADSGWFPRHLINHRKDDGTNTLLLTLYEDDDAGFAPSFLPGSEVGALMKSTNGGTTWTQVCTFNGWNPNEFDIATWGDNIYIVSWFATLRVTAGFPSGTGNLTDSWSEIDSPTTGMLPLSRVIEPHMGYMFIGGTTENFGSEEYATRIRWSHPNVPTAWRESDYIDINDGGGPIRALVSNGDHLLIFQEGAVKALFGYDADSWQLVEVSSTLGCPSYSAVCKSEDSVYFYSKPSGIFRIQGSSKPQEISEKIRPLVNSSNFSEDAASEVYLGWVDRKLWVSIPYYTESTATEPRTTLQWDPSIGGGVWTMHRTGDDYGLGPFLEGGDVGGQDPLACLRGRPGVVNLSGRGLVLGYDSLPLYDSGLFTWVGEVVNFTAHLRTKWIDGGAPTLKKQWRRPDILVKDYLPERTLTIDTYRDYNPDDAVRTKVLTCAANADLDGDTIYRAGSLGPARAVQLDLTGEAGKPWGVDAIVFKFIPRRMR